ncbi:MAG: alpha/beta hydrolase [Cellulomonas sp. 73-145]|uniref:alpha/beta hydrolase n=1 Tax=Cellulomonas sp. 73-145 TaxID=1895739 RepID=UPI0009266F37|nr:alpha/beta hydrolase [Cellulomonas sp. 73-145]MBN9327485.1 alpha/beta hydrolase [Cellulomonas sp.]OJV59139.1 MAG: alpha/beta hydrolase [Cellulomonas sp. 73-145]
MSRAQRHALDAMLRAAPAPDGPQTVDQLRTGFAAMMAAFAVPAGVRQTATELGGVPAVLVEPEAQAAGGTGGAILYFHGGSFVVGSPRTAMALTAHLVLRTGTRAISLDYRLAPDHPFPAAIEDGLAAYRALLDDGTPPGSIAFAGDSAGGGLTVTTCLAARDAGLPMPAAIVAFSPGLDHTRSGASMTTRNGLDPYFTPESFDRTGPLYVGGADAEQPLLAPAVHADLRGLPPMLLQVGTHELLLDDSVRLARRAVDADVDVVLDVTAGVPHVFPSFAGTLEEADQALDRAALFLRQHLEPPVGALH